MKCVQITVLKKNVSDFLQVRFSQTAVWLLLDLGLNLSGYLTEVTSFNDTYKRPHSWLLCQKGEPDTLDK